MQATYEYVDMQGIKMMHEYVDMQGNKMMPGVDCRRCWTDTEPPQCIKVPFTE
jgi:hypothetical protein